jgi:hypothetical protein
LAQGPGVAESGLRDRSHHFEADKGSEGCP